MYNQMIENKRLKSILKQKEDSSTDQKYMQSYAITNLETML